MKSSEKSRFSKIWEEVKREKNLNDFIDRNKVVVVEFIVPRGPDSISERHRHKLSKEMFPSYVFKQVDIENENMKKVVRNFRVFRSPTFIILLDGESTLKVVGAKFAKLKNALRRVNSRLPVVIDLAGRQRMLTQKMTKELLFFALGVTPSFFDLRRTMDIFAHVLHGLRHGNDVLPKCHFEDICEQLTKVEDIWRVYRNLLEDVIKQGKVSDGDIKKVYSLNVPLLIEMDTTVKMWVEKC